MDKSPNIPIGSVDDFHRIINVNLLGVMLCYQYAAKQMIKQGRGGRIIAASSYAGKQGTYIQIHSLRHNCHMATHRFTQRRDI